jgi:hypothetical protein
VLDATTSIVATRASNHTVCFREGKLPDQGQVPRPAEQIISLGGQIPYCGTKTLPRRPSLRLQEREHFLYLFTKDSSRDFTQRNQSSPVCA